jgi:hypothetical protein
MNVAFAPVPPGAFAGLAYDDAVSSVAVSLRRTIDAALARQTSMAEGRADQIAESLLTALRDAGHERLYATTDAYTRALALMRSLPSDLPLPEIVVEDDGEIGLDWEEGPRRVLSVSVGDSPMLRYAAFVGVEPLHGRVPFAGLLPETLSFLLGRIYPRR